MFCVSKLLPVQLAPALPAIPCRVRRVGCIHCLVIISNLQVWGVATDAAAGAETGAVARMHSALIAVVAHLLTRLGAQALGEAQVRMDFIQRLWTCIDPVCLLYVIILSTQQPMKLTL